MSSELLMTNGTTPATPASGKSKLYFNASKHAAMVDDAGNAIDIVTGASAQSSPANPTGSTSATGVMMGLAGSITPVKSGKVMFVISGNLSNNTNADGVSAQMYYNNGAAPANQAAITGNAIGSLATVTNVTTGNNKFPVTLIAVVTGLTLGTAYWFDVAIARITANTAAITDISMSAIEF